MPFSLSSSALNDYQRYLSLLVGNAAYVDTPPLTVDYLVIAGGGSGGYSAPGGGGAGGYRCSVSGESSGGGASAETTLTLTAGTNYTVTVGAGGAAVGPTATRGNNGSDSVFATITSVGGGGGGRASEYGKAGGSGGGSGEQANDGTSNGAPVSGQGFIGGYGNGGGGGAGQAGANGYGYSVNVSGTNETGYGGNGLASSITGSSVTRGGGGAGYARSGGGALTTTGGTGGGGNTQGSGTVNTGGGGGADQSSGGGGSGLVVVKYPIAYDMTVGAGLGYKTVMSGDYKITEFTYGTGTVSFALAPTVVGSGEDILQEIVLEESASSVTFSGLDAYASTYQHLQVRMTGRTTRATGTTSQVRMSVNGDTGSNYSYHGLYRSTVLGSFGVASQTSGYLGETSQATTASDVFGAFVMDVLDPFETTKYTTFRTLGGQATNWLSLSSTLWMNTDAVTSIEIIAEPSNNWVAGCRFTLIGVK